MKTMWQNGKIIRKKNGIENYTYNITIQFYYVKPEYVYTHTVRKGTLKSFTKQLLS